MQIFKRSMNILIVLIGIGSLVIILMLIPFGYNSNLCWCLLFHFMYLVKFVSHTVKHNVRRYPKHIRKLLTRKRAAWRALKLNNTPVLRARYDSIANQCRLEITNFDVTREQRILDANNLGAFYRFVNKKFSSKSGIAPLMNVNGDLIFSDTKLNCWTNISHLCLLLTIVIFLFSSLVYHHHPLEWMILIPHHPKCAAF